jgi:hypothetical protein
MKKWPMRECRLPECKRRFQPRREWQNFCRPEHQQEFQTEIKRAAALLIKFAEPIAANAEALPVLMRAIRRAWEKVGEAEKILGDASDAVIGLLEFVAPIAVLAYRAAGKGPIPGTEKGPAPDGKRRPAELKRRDAHTEDKISAARTPVNPNEKGGYPHG